MQVQRWAFQSSSGCRSAERGGRRLSAGQRGPGGGPGTTRPRHSLTGLRRRSGGERRQRRVCLSVTLSELTRVILTLFKGLVDVDEGEVVALWVLELNVALGGLQFQIRGRNQKTGWG